MVLYDSFIENLTNSLSGDTKVFDSNVNLKKSDKNAIIFTKETAFELGGSQKAGVSSLAVSSTKHFSNSVTVVGKDLPNIKEDCNFAKLVFVEINDIDDDDEAFSKIKELEYVRYNFSLDGLMSRASALNCREQIRVSKKAVKNKISFFDYGSMLIKEYLAFDFVKSVDVYFVTEFSDFSFFEKYAEKIRTTTSALNHILDNVMFDCSTCNLKEICDEVEGMKELHIKNSKKA